MSAAGCQHQVKWRLLYADPRLFRCGGSTTLDVNDPGCRALFVEGRAWLGEQKWIPTSLTSVDTFTCSHCLDGFCTSVDNSPCEKCGATSARAEATR